MSKIAPKEARAILVAAGLIKLDSTLQFGGVRRTQNKDESRQYAIEERKRMFKQASDNKKN